MFLKCAALNKKSCKKYKKGHENEVVRCGEGCAEVKKNVSPSHVMANWYSGESTIGNLINSHSYSGMNFKLIHNKIFY